MTEYTTVLQALRMRDGINPWKPGTIALNHEGKEWLWYRGSTQSWSVNERKDEDPRHQWQHERVHCVRCVMSIYDIVTLGKSDVVCEGERRHVERWGP